MMNQVMQRPLFRQQGSPMGGEQAFMQYLQTTLSPEQLQSLMQDPNRDQIIGQLYQKFMSEQQVQSSPIAMRQTGSPDTGEMSVPSFLQFNILDKLGVIDNSSLNREVPDKSYKINLDDAMTNPQLLNTVFEMITGSTDFDLGAFMNMGSDQQDDYLKTIKGRIIFGKAEGGEMKSDAVGIADGLDQEEPMTTDRDPSQEGIAKVSPDQYVELMNEIRGDEVPMDGRVQELAGVVGEKDATDTPLSVLALVQPVFELQEQKQGIANAPQGQQMMAQGPMPMANGGIVYRETGSNDLGEVTKGYYQQLQNIFPEYGAMQKASLFSPVVKAGLKIASGAPVFGGEDSALSEAITDYTNILPKIASASTPLKQSALKLASDSLIAEKAAKAEQKKFEQEFARDVYLKKMEVDNKKVETLGVVGSDATSNQELANRIEEKLGYKLDLSAYTAGSLIQIKPSGEIEITKAPTDKKIEYTVTYPVILGKGTNQKQSTKTVVIDISTPEGITKYNEIRNEMLKAEPAEQSLYNFEKIGGMTLEPNIPININPVIRTEKDGGIVYRSTGSNEEGEQPEEVIGVTDEYAEKFKDTTSSPTYIEGGTYPELAKGKIEQAELAMQNIAELYEKAFNNPLYVGVMGSGARTGKSILGAIDDIFNSFGYNVNLPAEDFFFAPIISEIKQAETNIATAVANVRRTQTGRSNSAREINLVKNDLDITGLNSSQGTLDSLKETWKEMADKANAQRSLVPGLEPIEYKEPKIFSQVRGTSEQKLNEGKLNIFMNLLPPELKSITMNDPDIKNAINAVIEGADTQLVIQRLKEIKGIE